MGVPMAPAASWAGLSKDSSGLRLWASRHERARCRAFDATPRAPRNCSGKWRPNSVPLTARYRESVLDEFYRLCVELAAGDGILTVSRRARVGVIFTFVLQPV
jgi:hypothetical protein